MNLRDKVILITGGATGIGRATADLCAAEHARVIVADINDEAGEEAARMLNGTFVHVNVSDEASVKAMVEKIATQFDYLDGWLHAAAILKGAHVALDEFTFDTWRSVLDVNLTGTFLCAKYAAPLLKGSGRGVVVLISSIAATLGSSSFAYGASKGGVQSLGITLAQRLAPDGIRVNVVSPDSIDTQMKRSVIAAEAERRGDPAKFDAIVRNANLGQPEGLAKVLAWLLSEDADYVRGTIFTR